VVSLSSIPACLLYLLYVGASSDHPSGTERLVIVRDGGVGTPDGLRDTETRRDARPAVRVPGGSNTGKAGTASDAFFTLRRKSTRIGMSAETSSSGGALRVLYVDSDPEETRRVATALEGEPGVADVVRETDPGEGLSRLATDDIDCVVSGYDLPGMDGVEFIEAVRETRADVPAILFTDSGSEAVASRAISAGVTDYVRKKPDGGGTGALTERVNELADDTDGASEGSGVSGDDTGFTEFVEAFPDVVFAVDEDGRYLDVIASGDESLLYDEPGELVGARFDEMLPAETADQFLGVLRDALETGERQRIEYRLDVQAGTRWFEARVGPLDTGGERDTAFWIARDITERKRRGREYEQIFDSVNDAITVFDPDAGEITEVNDAYREMLGYDLERIRELGIEGLSTTEEGYTGERGWNLVREVAETGDSETVEWQAETSEGDRVLLEATLTPAEIGGEGRVLSIQRDITERRELKRTYRDIFEGVSDGLVIHDPETGEILEVNERYCEMTGYDREELLDGSMGLIMPEDPAYTYDVATEQIRKAREEGSQLFEFKGERKHGEEFIGEVHLRTIEIRGNERVLASVRDITERKRREQEYEQIFDGVNDAIVIQDPETAAPIDANETFLDRLGYDDVAEIREEGLEGLSATESGYTEEHARELCHRVMETGDPEVVEWQQETKDGDSRWIEATVDAAVIRGEDRILSMQRDITGRKRREQAIESLQEATERLQRAETDEEVASVTVETASDVLDLPMAVCWFHEAGSDRLDPVAATDATHEAGLVSELSSERYEYAVFEDGAVTEYTPAEHDPDNPLDAGVLLPLGEHGLVAAGRRTETGRLADERVLDIAEALAEHATTALDRVARERELRESERRFRLIAERIDEVIYLATPDFSEVLYVNPAYESIWGRPVEELYDDARKFLEAVDPRDEEETRTGVREMVEEMQRGDPADSYEFEYRIRQPDGEIRWVNARGYAVEMAGGERRFVGIVNDITERKRREQRLEVFNRILRHNLRNQLDVIRSHAETLADRRDEDHAARIIAAADELAAMGARARRTDRIMSMDTDVTEVSLPDTLREVVEEVTPGEGIEVTTDLPASACLSTNGEALQASVRSAIENAVTYADSEVTVAVEEGTGEYTVVIDDDGPGIPGEELVPIEAGTETNLRHGRGLGLWQLRWGVDTLNGELSFDTEEGTTIRITVPDRARE
jgi:PAS domain S-box-containing protein